MNDSVRRNGREVTTLVFEPWQAAVDRYARWSEGGKQ
jgi:hypothetical protein